MRDDVDAYASADSSAGAPQFDIRALRDVLRRRWLVAVGVAFPLLVVATIYPFTMRHYYEATATVALRRTPEVMDIGLDFMPSEAGTPQWGQQSGGLSETSLLTLMMSDAVLGRVVERLPAPPPATKTALDKVRARLRGETGDVPLSDAQIHAERLDLLRMRITLEAVGGGAYLRITATDGAPGGAAFIANALAEAFVSYLSEHRQEASRRALTWLNQEIAELRDSTVRKEQTLAELQAREGLSPADVVEREDQGTPLADAERELQEARIELLATRERIAALRPRGTPDSDPSATASLREQYQTALTSLESARLRFTPTHPEVRRLEAIVENLSKRLESVGVTARGTSAEERAQLQTLITEEAGLQARVRVLERSRGDLSGGSSPRAAAVSRYKRLRNELEVDKGILDVLLTRRNETSLAAATKDTGASILDQAVAPTFPAGPRRMKYLAAGLILAVLAGFGAAFALEFLDTRVRDPDTIASLLGVSSLGLIPMSASRDVIPEREAGNVAGSISGESYRNVRTALLFAMRATKLRYLVVTSAVAGEGKTTTCSNLAAAFARMGKRVILVDADMRRPRLHRVFRVKPSPGISEVLQGQARIEDCVVQPDRTEFDLIPAGALPENPSELIGSDAFAQLMVDLKQEYDLAIIDSPVLLAVPDALLLAADADGTLIVHKPGSVDRRALRRIRQDLARAGANVLGVIFNQIDPSGSAHYAAYMYAPYVRKGGADSKTAARE